MSGIKKIMLEEALDISKAAEKMFREKLRLEGGKLPMKSKGTETLTWNALQKDIIDKSSKLN